MGGNVTIPAVLVGQDHLDELGPGSFEPVEKAGQVAEFGMDRRDVVAEGSHGYWGRRPQRCSPKVGGQVAMVSPGIFQRKSQLSQPQARVLVRVRPTPAAWAPT